MKVMHVLKHAVRGNGGVHVAVDLACAQADLGHQVVFASTRGSYDDVLRDHGVEVVDIPEAVSKTSAVRALRALLAVARRTRPDIIHAHMMSSALIGFPVAKITGATLVTTVHNSFDRHSLIMRLGKVVVAVSEAERELLISRGFTPHKVITILNGAAGSPRENLPYDDIGPLVGPSVVTLSGLHPRKAVGDVVAAFAQVHPEFPDWHLNIIGWGPDRERLEADVAARNLQNSVHFMGTTLTPRPLLAKAEIFATASLADPCPLTVTEARGAGCAIVGTTVGGIPEMLEHGRAGQLVPPSDPPAMAAAFRRLMGDPATLAQWRQRALDGAEYFTVTRVARDHVEVYRAALPRRRSSSGESSAPVSIGYFVPPSQHFAGIERVVHEIATGLAEAEPERFEVHVLYASDYHEALLATTSYRRHVLGVDRLRHLAPSLRRSVADLDLDVLVCPQVEASTIAWLATRGLRLPVLLPHLHGNPRLEERDGSRATKVAFGVFRHLVSRRVPAVLAVSPSLRRYAAQSLTGRTPVYYAANPVRTLDVGAVVAPEPGQQVPFRFLNVARLSYQKGQDILLRALALARPDLPEVRLTLVGNGPEEHSLRRLSTELGLDDIVTFAGYASDPAEFFAAADCFVFASRWEGFGVVLVEALQHGLPLLATDCDFGPGDVITDDRIGDLVVPEDPDALAEGLRLAVKRTFDAADVGHRRAAARAYSRSTVTELHADILDRVVASTR